MNCFVSGAADVRSYPGYARHISAEAACLLTTRPMVRGEPVEAAVGPREHVAGLVTYCRHVSDGIFEVGVEILNRAHGPVLGGDQPGWVDEALRASHGSSAPYCRSA